MNQEELKLIGELDNMLSIMKGKATTPVFKNLIKLFQRELAKHLIQQ